MATAVFPHAHKNYINGKWVTASGGKGIENRNPANGRFGGDFSGVERGGREPRGGSGEESIR